MTDTAIFTCLKCGHSWDQHLTLAGVAGGCCHPRCYCTEPRRVITPAERIAAIREQLPTEPLVSHACDKRPASIGAAAFRRVPELTDQTRHGGTVVELWMTEDGEPGVITLDFAGRKGALVVTTTRLAVAELAEVHDADPHRCWRAVRQIEAYLGQRQTTAGPPYTAQERWLDSRSRLLIEAATNATRGAA